MNDNTAATPSLSWEELRRLPVPDWHPVSQLRLPATEVERAAFPAIDVHNHLGRWLSDGEWIGSREMNKIKRLANQQERRRHRVRNKLKGSGRVRLSVFRSNLYFRCQAIDDQAGNTVAAAWSGEVQGVKGCDAAAAVGKLIAERLLAAGVSQACLDRGEYRYHGRVKAFADGARGAGLDL